MSYSVLRKGRVVVSNLTTLREAEKYVESKTGFFGEPKSYYKIRKDGCYLTTAAVDYKGLSDDCQTLTTLRYFRDHYLLSFDEGRKAVADYYRLGPDLVDRINQSAVHEQILEDIYTQLICPCVALIEAHAYQEAYDKYKAYTLSLQHRLLE